MRERVTACIVTRNSAELISDCIASVRAVVDDVIVVDNESSDETAAVARAAGARVLRAVGNHELARNAYLEAAATEWVLVIDDDERLASPLPPLAADVDAYAVERHDFIGDGRWASTRLVRLFRRAPQIRYFASTAHAAVAPSIASRRIAFASTVLHHLDALLPRDHAARRANMRSRLEAELRTEAAPPILRCFYALELFAIGDEDNADRELTRAFASGPRIEPMVTLFRAQQHRGRARWREAEISARRCLSLATDVFRGRESAWAVLADALDQQGRADEALSVVDAALAESNVASHRINRATLLGADAPREAPAIAMRPGGRPSIFVQQDALLTRYRAR